MPTSKTVGGMRPCCMCKGVFPATTEYFNHKGKGRLDAACRPCSRKRQQEWYRKNPEWKRRNRSLSQFGVTHEELMELQGNACAICGTNTPGNGKQWFAIDHDHVTGQTRGALCHPCNLGLGHFKDNPAVLKAANEYLRRWNGTANADNPQERQQWSTAA